MSSEWTDPRPMSPHLQVWRFHITMLVSILHRACGMALYAGAIMLTAWLWSIAAGPETYGHFEDFALSLIGRGFLFAFTLAAMFHLANGVRHLLWDLGSGFEPSSANATAWLTFLFAFAATLGVWSAVYYL